MSFNSYAEQTNYMSFIHNMIPINHNQFIRAPLELYIPSEYCKLLSEVSKMPLEEDDSIYKFLRYMNSIWYHPITYKLKGSSNNHEFFMYYLADLDTVFQEPQAGPGVKDGQIRRNFDISMTVRIEFNTIGYLTLNSPEFKRGIHIVSKDDIAIAPIFSDAINLDDFDLPVGWSVLSWPIFKLKPQENSISLIPLLNQSLTVTIDHHLKMGIPIERSLKIQSSGRIHLPDHTRPDFDTPQSLTLVRICSNQLHHFRAG